MENWIGQDTNMRWIIDSAILIQFALKDANKPLFDPRSGNPIDRLEYRTKALVDLAESSKATIAIPAPVLAEFLVGVDTSEFQKYLDLLHASKVFEILSFDEMAAIECALLVDDNELKQIKDTNDTKAKVRFDRQIVAICKAHNAEFLFTHDKAMLSKAEAVGIQVKSLADIEPMPEQTEIDV